MTKKELLQKYEELTKVVDCKIDGIGVNSNKASLESAIKCLQLSDDELDELFIIFKHISPNTYIIIANNGDWKRHRFNRYYVFSVVNTFLNSIK